MFWYCISYSEGFIVIVTTSCNPIIQLNFNALNIFKVKVTDSKVRTALIYYVHIKHYLNEYSGLM